MSAPPILGQDSNLSAFGFEDIDRPLDPLDELIEDMKHGFTFNNLNVSESYRKGELNALIEVGGGGVFQDLEFIFCALPNHPSWRSAVRRRDGNAFERERGFDKVGVFIDQVEIVKGTEKIAVPSIVWLKLGNSRTYGFGNFLALRAHGRLEPRLIDPMREIRFIRRLSIQYGTSTNRLIESGSEIVDGVCGGKPEIAGQWLCKVETEQRVPSSQGEHPRQFLQCHFL